MILGKTALGGAVSNHEKPVRIGFVGVGHRGTDHVRSLVAMKGIEVPAVCDINPAAAAQAQDIVAKSGQARPEAYTKGDEDFRRLMERSDLDAVIVATSWEWHTPVAVSAMKTGKYAGVEVP